MIHSLGHHLLLVVIIVCAVLFMMLAGCALPMRAMLLPTNHVYDVVWSCTAQLGCYAEVLRIDQWHADGWADVTTCGLTRDGAVRCEDDHWRSNLSQALSIRLHQQVGLMPQPGSHKAQP